MKRRSPLILLAFVILIASCGKKGGDTGLLVPEDAAIVFHINMASLSSKLSWEEVIQSYWFKAEMAKSDKKDDSVAARLLANPATSGINTKADLVLYIKKQGRGGYLVFGGTLTDAAVFEKFIKETNKDVEIKKRGSFSIAKDNKDGIVIWNASRFAMVDNSQIPDMGSMRKGGQHSYSLNKFSSDSLEIFGENALTLKSGDNLDSDTRFASLIKDNSDMHFWMNMSDSYGDLSTAMPMINTSIFKGNVMAASINFENGKISAKAKQYYGDAMNKILSNNKAENIKADVINRIPSSNVLGVMAFNYSPDSFREILKAIGVDGLADMFLTKAGFTLDDLTKAMKGEMLVSFSDFSIVPKKDTFKLHGSETRVFNTTKQDVNILFATGVKDKAAFEKLITFVWDIAKQFGGRGRDDDDEDNMPSTPGSIPGIHYKLEKDWFAVGNNTDFVNKFLEGGNNKHPFTDKITGHPMGVYLDLQKILAITKSYAGHNPADSAGLKAATEMWQDVVATGGEYKDKAIQFEMEVNLVDKNTNSLKQLNSFLDKMMVLKKEKMKGISEVTIEEIQMEGVKDEPTPPPPPVKKPSPKK